MENNSKDISQWIQDKSAIALMPREQAYLCFKEQGIPTTKDENWNYTDLKILQNLALLPGVSKSLDSLPDAVEKLIFCDDYLIFVNGVFSKSLSKHSFDDSKIQVKTISELNEEEKSLVNSLVHLEEEAFVALNTTILQDLAFINVSKNTTITKPLQIINILEGSSAGEVYAPRVFVNVEKNSKLELLETYYSTSEEIILNCPVAEYNLSDNSELSIDKLILESENTFHLAAQQAKLSDSARCTNKVINLSAKLIRNNTNATLTGANANASLLGLSVLKANEHVDNHTVLDHVAPHCESYEVYKGIYADSAKGVFDGTIIVRPGAQKTNAIQSNQGLLLSDKATNYSKPQLKIWADDVKCTHGATCGALDEEALFYLRSRGIPEEHARSLLIEAFAREILDNIGIEKLKIWLSDQIHRKLARL